MKKQLSKTELKALNEEILKQFRLKDFFAKKEKVEIAEAGHALFVLHEGRPVFFYHEGRLVPTLKLLLAKPQPILKQVVVDMGAVPFVTSGADLMRPGIVELDHAIKKDELVVIVDAAHKKPLAIGKALLSGEETFKAEKGKVVAVIHYVGDKYWKAFD